MTAGPGAYAVLSAIVFGLGLFGVLSRRNAFAALCAMALLLLAPVIALAGFAHLGTSPAAAPVGDGLALLAVVAAASEVVVGAGLVVLAWRRLGSTDTDRFAGVDD